MSRIASRNGRPASLSEGPSTPVSPAAGKAAQKANGVLLRKQSAGDTPRLSNGTGASQRLAAKLSELLSRFQGKEDAEAALRELSEDVSHLRSVEEEITGYAEQALEETERLKKENGDLRKAAEDAALDKQMSSAVAEAEKLRAAGDAHKRDLVQAKLVEREAELASMRDKLRAANREVSNMTRALSEARNATTARAKEAEVLKQELAQLRAGSNGSAATASQDKDGEQQAQPEAKAAMPAAAQSTSPLASEHAEIAARLMAAGPGGVDIALLTAAAKALRDVSVLDKQFLRAREEKEALAREVEHLNSTVFSKHFKAPSAWAEREVKYKMEKRDWDAESRKLREMLAKLEADNAAYRASNKTAEFEAQIQELKATVDTKEAEKVAVQKQLHELQIQGRSGNAPPRDDHEAIQGIIGDMEAHGIGHAAPMTGTPVASSRGSPSPSARGSPPRAAAPPLHLSSHYLPGSNVEEIIQDYDEKGLGIGRVQSGRKQRTPRRLAQGNGSLPVNGSSDSLDGIRGANIRNLQSNFDGADQVQRDGATTRSTSYGSLHSNQALDGRDLAPQSSAEPDVRAESPHAPAQRAQHSGADRTTRHQPSLQSSQQQGELQSTESSPSPSVQRKEWVPFGSPLELSTAMGDSEKGPALSSMARAAEAEAAGAAVARLEAAPADSAADADASELVRSLQGSAADPASQQGGGHAASASAHLEQPQHHRSVSDAPELSSRGDLPAEHRDQAPGSLQALPPENWASSRSRLMTGDDGLSETSSSAGALVAGRGGTGVNRSIGRDSSSDGGDEWDPERRAALQADRAAAEAAWGAHVADNDIASLRWKAAEADSQVQLYKAQISKMQLALERADQENSRVEHELRVALEAPGKLREAQAEKRAGASSLSTLRDRVRSMSLLSPSLEGQAAWRLQDAREKLKSSQHELAAIQKQRDDLARQLALIAEKIGSGVIPDPADLAVPEHIAAAAEASASAPRADGDSKAPADGKAVGRPRLSSIGHVYAGLSDEEVEVMRLRDENEALMETLVRTKVELAETQGDYLKTKRSLLRAVEKQVLMAERYDNLKMAVQDKDLMGASSLLANSPTRPAGAQELPAGVLKPLGEQDGF